MEKYNKALKIDKVLSDRLAIGKKINWQKYKQQSVAVANAYRHFEELVRYAQRISDCGAVLKFAVCAKDDYRRLLSAHFCKCRLCVMCQWRKSLVMFHQILNLVHAHKAQYSSDVPLLLTLTVPNVKAENLSAQLGLMSKSWNRLAMRGAFKRSVRAWFRALEITYNEQRNDFHPHFHVLLMVPKDYFDSRRNLYISQNKWLQFWQEATGIAEITQVDIRKVKKQSKHAAVESVAAEVAKYATKPSSYIKRVFGEFKAEPKIIETLHYVLKGRRLVGFGGLFLKLRKKLRQEDIEKADLIEITDELQDCKCPVCQSTLVEEIYRWHVGLKNYVG